MLLLALDLTASGCAGSSGRTPTGPELAIERRQLLSVFDGLRSSQTSVARELQASRATWRAIARGLPDSPSRQLRQRVRLCSARARELAQPAFMRNIAHLSGPAAGLGGLYESFVRLSSRGWSLIEASLSSIAGGNHTSARFALANSSLYIDAVYDAHFDLSLVGKSLSEGYRHLGGARAFRAALTPVEVHALAHAYSVPAVRLAPHPTAH